METDTSLIRIRDLGAELYTTLSFFPLSRIYESVTPSHRYLPSSFTADHSCVEAFSLDIFHVWSSIPVSFMKFLLH